MWIQRENNFLSSQKSLALVLVGLRQVGKSSSLRKWKEEKRSYITLDDPSLLGLASNDPELFLDQHPFPLIVDECQLAPMLFRPLKRRLDELKYSENDFVKNGKIAQTPLWLSGSNQTLVDKNIQESLAGRVSLRKMHPLSLFEIKQNGLKASLEDLLLRGGWPALWQDKDLDYVPYVNNYLSTAVEKDVVLFQGIEKVEAFRRAVRLLAGRTGNILKTAEVARDAGLSATTVHSWVDGLTRLGITHLVQPFHTNISKRLIKSPKLYFADTSLASRLCGWSDISPLSVSPQVGALFENLVFNELLRFSDNFDLNWQINFFRTRDGEEIDFVVEGPNQQRIALECKLGGGDPLRAQLGKEAQKVFGEIPHVLVGLRSKLMCWKGQVSSCPPEDLGEHLSKLFGQSFERFGLGQNSKNSPRHSAE